MLFLLFSRPHLIPFIAFATLETMHISDKKFDDHSLDTISNAYKHALWNILIAYHIQVFYGSPEKALLRAKRITDMHEECFKNRPEAETMDLANNEIGRNIYLKAYKEFNRKPKKKILLQHLSAEQDSFIYLED